MKVSHFLIALLVTGCMQDPERGGTTTNKTRPAPGGSFQAAESGLRFAPRNFFTWRNYCKEIPVERDGDLTAALLVTILASEGTLHSTAGCAAGTLTTSVTIPAGAARASVFLKISTDVTASLSFEGIAGAAQITVETPRVTARIGTEQLTNLPPSPTTVSCTYGVYVSHPKLFVADSCNHRVLIWDSIPTDPNTPANVVLGQPNFYSNIENADGIGSLRSLRVPTAIVVKDGKLIVSDYGGGRILIWDTVPTVNYAPASRVLLQGVGAFGLAFDRYFVVPTIASTVAVYDGLPTSPTQAPLYRFGAGSESLCRTSATAQSLCEPGAASIAGNNILVSDRGNYRVLRFDLNAQGTTPTAASVIGQPNFVSREYSSALNGMKVPLGQAYNGALFVADSGNSRVLIYNSLSMVNQPTADLQITGTAGSPLATFGLFANLEYLILTDSGRVQIYALP